MGPDHDVTGKAVILARGLGRRMRHPDPVATLDPEQRRVAEQGVKGLIPVGRPFLDYVLSGLADAGCSSVCLVIGPGPDPIRQHYTAAPPSRVALSYAVQEQPLGTADAVLAAEAFAETDSVLVLNSDNLYPTSALKELASLRPGAWAPAPAGLLGFRRSVLLAAGIPARRISAYALMSVTEGGFLDRIVEKPGHVEAASFGDNPLVSMNAWLLPPGIYDACRAVTPSARGELELQDAVKLAMERGQGFRVVESEDSVLDLSSRSDIAGVTAALRGVPVRL